MMQQLIGSNRKILQRYDEIRDHFDFRKTFLILQRWMNSVFT